MSRTPRSYSVAPATALQRSLTRLPETVSPGDEDRPGLMSRGTAGTARRAGAAGVVVARGEGVAVGRAGGVTRGMGVLVAVGIGRGRGGAALTEKNCGALNWEHPLSLQARIFQR